MRVNRSARGIPRTHPALHLSAGAVAHPPRLRRRHQHDEKKSCVAAAMMGALALRR
jgi:hypothetical protein